MCHPPRLACPSGAWMSIWSHLRPIDLETITAKQLWHFTLTSPSLFRTPITKLPQFGQNHCTWAKPDFIDLPHAPFLRIRSPIRQKGEKNTAESARAFAPASGGAYGRCVSCVSSSCAILPHSAVPPPWCRFEFRCFDFPDPEGKPRSHMALFDFQCCASFLSLVHTKLSF